MVCRIFFCSELPDNSEKSWRKRSKWRKPANVKRIVCQANAIRDSGPQSLTEISN